MDYMCWQMIGVFNYMGCDLVVLLIVLLEYECEEMMEVFNDLLGYVGGLNCMYMDNDLQFNDVSEKVEVMDIYEVVEKVVVLELW